MSSFPLLRWEDSGYRDGGILDFGREHAFLDIETQCAFVLPTALVDFIKSLDN